MTDFTKLNAKPWCECCTNEQVFRAAEELCDHVIQKHYQNPMCIGSTQSVVELANYLFGFVLAGKIGHDMANENPILGAIAKADFGAIRDLGAQVMTESESARHLDVSVFMNEHDKNAQWETAFMQRIVVVQELRKADEAFNAENASPSKPT